MKPEYPNILITRPLEDAAPLACRLEELGYGVFIEPMIEIRQRSNSKNDLQKLLARKPQAILATSANGIRAFAKLTEGRDWCIITVGDQTASIATQMGFTNVASANGDALGLTAFVNAHIVPEEGWLLHVCGSETAGDLGAMLGEQGYSVEKVVLYDAVAVNALTSKFIAIITSGEIDQALFYSPRTASIFMKCIEKEELQDYLKNIRAVCLSAAIADNLKGTLFKDVMVAAYMNTDSMLETIKCE